MEARENNNFDLLRICAALQVALVHAADHLKVHSAWIDWLTIFPGVPIFFVISGYLVSASFERSSVSQYAVNRVARIYPGLWGCLAFCIALVSFIGLTPTWRWIAAQATVAQVYNPDFLRHFGTGVLNGSLWSIPVELQFYALLPLLYVGKRFGVLFWAALGMNVLYELHPGRLAAVTVFPYLYLFLIGVVLQRNPDFVRRYLAGRLPWWLPAYVITAVALSFTPMRVGGNELNPLSAILLGLTVISAAYARAFPLKHDLSYGLYLYHMPVINLAVMLDITGYEGMALTLGTSIFLATLSWAVIERPALRLKSHLKRSVAGQPPAPGDRVIFDIHERRGG